MPDGLNPTFLTLTFPADRALDETEAQRCWRSLVRRLRYRKVLGEYGFVLQRTRRGTLHFHSIAQMLWMDDGLEEWRTLIAASGFGVQNKLVVAEPSHVGYLTRYISSGLAELAPLRRAYAFSRNFPVSPNRKRREQEEQLMAEHGAMPECQWQLTGSLRAVIDRAHP